MTLTPGPAVFVAVDVITLAPNQYNPQRFFSILFVYASVLVFLAYFWRYRTEKCPYVQRSQPCRYLCSIDSALMCLL